MLMRIFIVVIIILAIAVGLAPYVAHDSFNAMALHDFFTATLPILGCGALIKYLCKCHHHCGSCHK
jgi:hypothetical protein